MNDKIMKTMNKILLAAVVALSTTVVYNVKADGALFSPRALGNQIHRIAGTNDTVVNAKPVPGNALLSPRAQGNQIVRAAGAYNDPDLVAAMQALPGTPRAKSLQPLIPTVYEIAPMK